MESLQTILTTPKWVEHAACASYHPELWWADDPNANASTIALGVCGVCPVRADCLEHALTVPEQEGIWGGLTAKERRKMSRERKAVA